MRWPKHIAADIEHNPHRLAYETVAEYIEHPEPWEDDDWVSPAERMLSIEQNELWVLRWYPETPVGFCQVAASTLIALLEWAEERTEE